MSVLQVASIAVEPGQSRSGYALAPVGAVQVPLPLLLANGARPGPRLALTAGVHYGEFVGVEALLDLFRTIDAAALGGQLVACPVACPPAVYEHRSGVSPLDGVNPNRVYPGSASGRPTERLVYWLFEHVIRAADVFIDLHSGAISEDLSPFVAYRTSGDPELDRRALELAGLFGLPIVRGASPAGGNSHAAAMRAGVVSLLVEVGARGSRSAEEVNRVSAGLRRVMHRLGMLESAPSVPAGVPVQRWRWADEVEAPVEGLWYPDFQVGEDVAAGRVLGRIVDPLGPSLVE